jgi:hypothetical protein
MIKKYSLKFWIIFWVSSIFFLTGWYFYWETQNKGVGGVVSNAIGFLPIGESQKKEYQAVSMVADYLMKKDGEQKTILVLFQNNLELRPGGGFIGAFGIVKTLDGKVLSIETHDLANFDARIPDTVTPPYPMRETLNVKSWKLRDSNYSPDFVVNAKKAEEFYHMGDGQENFDAIIGLTTNVLTSMLKVTGPVQLEGYPGTYDSENAIISLEYQVEKAFEDQGIARGERKSIMSDLAKQIQKRVSGLSISKKIEMAQILLSDLNGKDIQLYFKDEKMQKFVEDSAWAGKVDENWKGDYLMAVDANLGAFKSDYYMKRSMDYTVDFSAKKPTAHLEIKYIHTATQKDWMTKDYITYLRVYVPEGSWFTTSKNFEAPKFESELGKRYFGSIVRVPLASEKTVEINYTLPENITENDYKLLIQKQAGVKDIPVAIHLISKDGSKKDFNYTMNSDIITQN